jgi:hypothetical protein
MRRDDVPLPATRRCNVRCILAQTSEAVAEETFVERRQIWAAAAPKTSPTHPKRWLCTALHVLDVGGVISQPNKRLWMLRMSQSDEAWAVEGPCNVGLAAQIRSAS